MSKNYYWKCLRCGECCVNTVNKTSLGTFGVFLLPHEAKLFDTSIVRPMYGVGVKGKSRPRPAFIFAYQMIAQPCPYYNANGELCKIYSVHPMTCQQFPLASGIVSVGVHRECPAIRKYIPDNIDIKAYQLKGFDKEFKASKIINMWFRAVYLINVAQVDLEYQWYYLFKKEKWVRPTRAQLVEALGEMKIGIPKGIPT